MSIEIELVRFIAETCDCATREHRWTDTFIVTMHFACYVRDTASRSTGAIPRLIQMFPRYSRRSDASIGRHSFPSGDKCVYDISALPHLPGLAQTRQVRRIARFLVTGKGDITRTVIAVRHAVLQTAVNIVYWLPPPISQTLVTRSCRSPTANKPRAVIWRPLSSLSRFPNIPSPLWRTLHFPSLRQQHVHLGQIEKDLVNTRNSKLIPVAGIKTLRDKNNEVFLLCVLLGRMSKLLASSV